MSEPGKRASEVTGCRCKGCHDMVTMPCQVCGSWEFYLNDDSVCSCCSNAVDDIVSESKQQGGGAPKP